MGSALLLHPLLYVLKAAYKVWARFARFYDATFIGRELLGAVLDACAGCVKWFARKQLWGEAFIIVYVKFLGLGLI